MNVNCNDIIPILRAEKPTILEGYIPEKMYLNFLTGQSGAFCSSGWWIGELNWEPYYFLHLQDRELNPADIAAIKFFRENKIKVFLASHIKSGDNYSLYIKDLSICPFEQLDFIENIPYQTESEFIENYNLHGTPRAPYDCEGDQNLINRRERCINELIKLKMAESVALERSFANTFMSAYIYNVRNIDLITLSHNGKLIIHEIKFKRPDAKGRIGINIGEYDMLQSLNSIGCKILIIVLFKKHPANIAANDYSIIDYTTGYLDRFWFLLHLTFQEQYSTGTAPSSTSLNGNRDQDYIAIPFGKFLLLNNTVKLLI